MTRSGISLTEIYDLNWDQIDYYYCACVSLDAQVVQQMANSHALGSSEQPEYQKSLKKQKRHLYDKLEMDVRKNGI